MRHLLKICGGLTFIVYLTSTGCVSVDVLPPAPKKATDVKIKVPTKDFKEIINSSVDRAWQNDKNGNTIAYLSECNSKSDPTLKAIETENLTALTNVEVIESKSDNFNDREALFSSVKGQVDGVPVKMRLIIFKKNGCNYTLSYVGRSKFFDHDVDTFKTFTEGFSTP